MAFYSDEEVKIFEYYNGEVTRYVDPLDIQLKLMSDTSFDWDHILLVWQTSMEALGHFKDENDDTPIDEEVAKRFAPELADSMGKLIVKSREVFGLPDLGKNEDGEYTGVPATKVMDVLSQYMMFCAELKKTADDTQISAESSEQDGSEEMDDSVTENGSEFTSTSDESNTEEAYL